MEQAEKIAKYDKLKKDYLAEIEKRKYWKCEYDKMVVMLKEREKKYCKTNALKDKKIRELESKMNLIEESNQTRLF